MRSAGEAKPGVPRGWRCRSAAGLGGSAGLLQPPLVPALSQEGPSSPEQRTEDLVLSFPVPSLHLMACTALEAPGLLGNGPGTLAGDASQPRAGRSELPAGTSHRNPSQGKENAAGNAEASALSHLISSFAAFRGRFNLLGLGKRLTLQRAGCRPMTRGCPRPRDSSSGSSQGHHRGSLSPPRQGHVSQGHAWGRELCPDCVTLIQQAHEAAALRHIAAPSCIPWPLDGFWSVSREGHRS